MLLILFLIIHVYFSMLVLYIVAFQVLFNCFVIAPVVTDILGDSSHSANHRLISLISMFSKVFESFSLDKLLFERFIKISF